MDVLAEERESSVPRFEKQLERKFRKLAATCRSRSLIFRKAKRPEGYLSDDLHPGESR